MKKAVLVALAALLIGCASGGRPRNPAYDLTSFFPVAVNYDLTLEEMVVAGKYNHSDSEINEANFPIRSTEAKEVVIQIVCLGDTTTTQGVLLDLERRNLRPATLPELLAFGATYPNEQRNYSIIALGSRGDGFVPHLFGYWSKNSDHGGWRQLLLSAESEVWPDYYKFAAVSK